MRSPWLRSLALATCWACTACNDPDAALPDAYRRLVVPEARLGAAEARALGEIVFAEHCALCHGERGDGRGQRSESLSTQPADFTDPAWQARTSDRRIFYVIREGARGTAMPAWKALSESETWDVVAYVRGLGPPTRP